MKKGPAQAGPFLMGLPVGCINRVVPQNRRDFQRDRL
jgi:hypothetical protein